MKHWLPAVFCLAVFAASCGKKLDVSLPPPTPARIGAVETGEASWYGKPYHGRRTSNGEVYDMNGLTAAHLSLPFDTRVRVTNLANGRSVELRINDRGPFLRARVIDVSRKAAQQLDMMASGTARVRLEVIAAPGGPPPAREVAVEAEAPCGKSQPAVQVGSFRDAVNAARLLDELTGNYGPDARIVVAHTAAGPLHRVVVGAPNAAAAGAVLAQLERDGRDGFLMHIEADADCLVSVY
ncbi:MAG: septal ring lytic transglycosylase RlpA family protein [Acidobacteria bacterium]|nr:septal ring lytic transglycosylase RlpA family protein [Acidobacteriota bacterium]